MISNLRVINATMWFKSTPATNGIINLATGRQLDNDLGNNEYGATA
jgi:hypothetical protein